MSMDICQNYPVSHSVFSPFNLQNITFVNVITTSQAKAGPPRTLAHFMLSTNTFSKSAGGRQG